MYPIESLLSARQFLVPQTVGDHIYFVSNMSGRLSLYRMKAGGSIPEPLLPPELALQNPHLMGTLYPQQADRQRRLWARHGAGADFVRGLARATTPYALAN